MRFIYVDVKKLDVEEWLQKPVQEKTVPAYVKRAVCLPNTINK